MERQPHPDDRHSSFAAITADGRRRLRVAAPHYLGTVQDHYLSHLSRQEISVISEALSRVVEAEQT